MTSAMTDPYRLPTTVLPTRYDLRLEPDLERCTFSGEETVTVTVREPGSEILLNAVELEIHEVSATDLRGYTVRGTTTVDEKTERARLSFPEALMPGEWRLTLTFTGVLNDKLHGFYRSRYKDANGNERYLAATQFEATDARRAFPCWDEPDKKAVFQVTLVIDASLVAISNSRVLREEPVPGKAGKKVVTFADSIKMSTYLVAFVVGELEATEPVRVNGTPIRVWCIPGKQRLAHVALEIAAYSLRFFQEYYGIPYPGDKLDLIAIPDFASGAMENLGAITFRETALLVDRQVATHSEIERVAVVVAHENAHMWFGDLVTMAWWNGLWLNEAFATFMEMLAVDAWKPEWETWVAFGVSRAAAFSVDGLQSTRPIEFHVTAPKDADAMFDVLTYEKGAAVLRMLQQYLGPDTFRDGVNRYLKKHAYANADTRDLWAALGEASGQPIPEVLDAWIFRGGYPIVTVRHEGGQLVLSQTRFTYLSCDDPQVWKIPVGVRMKVNGKVVTKKLLLEGPEMRIEIEGALSSVVVNEGGHGFYRVRYAPDLQTALESELESLPSIERFQLIADSWAATVAGLMPIKEYLDLTVKFRVETDKNVWSVIIGSLGYLDRVVNSSERPRLEALVRDRLRPAGARLGWAPSAGETDLQRQLRGDLLRSLGTLGNDQDVQMTARELYARWQADPSAADPNVVPALIHILAHAGGEAEYQEFFEQFKRAITPQEEQRYLYSLAGFRQSPLLQRTLEKTINGEIRTQDAPFVVRSILTSVYGRELAWRFVKEQWETMERLFPSKAGIRRMCEGITALATPELEADVREFFASRRIDLGGKTLQQYLEQLHIATVFKARETAALSVYLTDSSPTELSSYRRLRKD
jgi:puromycin-sensitive aminopeptidase